MKRLPETQNALVLRTDFWDDAAWDAICAEIGQPVGDFQAYVECVSDPEFVDFTIDQLLSIAAESSFRSFVFIVDSVAFSDDEHPILVVDLFAEPGRTFRVIPRVMWSVENNLSIANMDFEEFADSADANGVFRGF